MTVIGEMWEDKYNALLEKLRVAEQQTEVAYGMVRGATKVVVTAEERIDALEAKLEKANTEDWSPKVQVYKDKLEVAEDMLRAFISYVEDSVLMDYENRSYGLDTLVDKAREAIK